MSNEKSDRGVGGKRGKCPNCGKPLEEHTHTQRTICHVELNK